MKAPSPTFSEFANVILVNKFDLASKETVVRVTGFVKQLNSWAIVLLTTPSKCAKNKTISHPIWSLDMRL
ncbi:hypothetical protein HDU67_008209 [Dinochytrium kinnereticum]|nr:hypothetical protein HDU67_008209 [Dinochytrium kinnereticum]